MGSPCFRCSAASPWQGWFPRRTPVPSEAVFLCSLTVPACALAANVPARLPKPARRCDNAQVTGLSVALANLKPGTGKTTSAVWLAHVFAQAGNSVLLVDADPSGSALEWSDLAAMYPRLAPLEAAFPFRIVALPSRDLRHAAVQFAGRQGHDPERKSCLQRG